jgi:hypothetical protein
MAIVPVREWRAIGKSPRMNSGLLGKVPSGLQSAAQYIPSLEEASPISPQFHSRVI